MSNQSIFFQQFLSSFFCSIIYKIHCKTAPMVKRHATKMYRREAVKFHTCLTSKLGGGYGQFQFHCFINGERSSAAYWIGDWIRSKTGLNVMWKDRSLPLPGIELQSTSPDSHFIDWDNKLFISWNTINWYHDTVFY